MDSGHDPSTTSYCVTDALYQNLVDDFSGWRETDREIVDPVFRDSCIRLLNREARYLDEYALEDWIGLYAPECIYWVPASEDGGDPRTEVAITFEDRRRLEDRIFRLRTDNAWSQRPVSRTVRLISNVEVFSTDEDDIYMFRSTFQTTELQDQDERVWSGWAAHRVADRGNSFEILVKQVNLINYDHNLRNPSIIL